MKLLYYIPNTLTLLNLFFGCVAVVYGLNGDLKTLALFVLLGMLCDFFDGFFARLLKIKSKLGSQLDSLSDLVTFGMSSSIVIFVLLNNSTFIIQNSQNTYIQLIPFLSFLITIASSYRLAKFNLDDNGSYFKGLPTPANALLIVFMPFLLNNELTIQYVCLLENTFFLIFLIFSSSFFLNCKIKMFSFKAKSLTFDNSNKIEFLFLLISIILLIIFNLGALPLIIIIYIIINLFRIKF